MKSIFLEKFGVLTDQEGPIMQVIEYLPELGNSLVLGLLLSITSYLTGRAILDKTGKNFSKKNVQLILASSNILYLCIGLSAVMILVNNSLARALSVGAAISLVRFRRKLGDKSNDSNILFGIIAGMACGLGVIDLAWIISMTYILISIMLTYLTKNIIKEI